MRFVALQFPRVLSQALCERWNKRQEALLHIPPAPTPAIVDF
jgi:hypothetical protein